MAQDRRVQSPIHRNWTCGACSSCQETTGREISVHPECPLNSTTCGHDVLKLHTYEAHVLAEALIDLFANKTSYQLTKLQAGALERWNEWYPSVVNNQHRSRDLNLLPPLSIFNDFFFGGVLRGHVIVQWDTYTRQDGMYGCSLLEPNGKCMIEIGRLKRHQPHQKWTHHTIHNILDTLLHEMAHAVFFLFKCNCRVCACQRNEIMGRGLSGHGPAWTKLCKAIQEDADRWFRQSSRRWVVVDAPSLDNERQTVKSFHFEGPNISSSLPELLWWHSECGILKINDDGLMTRAVLEDRCR